MIPIMNLSLEKLIKFSAIFSTSIGLALALGVERGFACFCSSIEKPGYLPNLKDDSLNGAIFAGKVISVVDPKSGGLNISSFDSPEHGMLVDTKEIWKGEFRKSSVIFRRSRMRCCENPPPFGNSYPEYWDAKSPYVQEGKDYIFFSYSDDLSKAYYRDSVLLEQGQAIFTDLDIKQPPSNQKIPSDGIPLVCSLQSINESNQSEAKRNSELFWLAYPYAARGDRLTAVQIAERISSRGLRANLLLALTNQKPDLKNYEEALQTLKDTEWPNLLLETMVRRLAETQQLEGAVQIARKIKDRAKTFTFIANKYVEIEKYNQALMLISEISDESLKGHVISGVIQAYLKRDKIDLALQLTPKITSKVTQTRTLLAIAKRLSETDDYEKAIQVVNSIDHSSPDKYPERYSRFYDPTQEKLRAFSEIAELAAKSGRLDVTMQIAEKVPQLTKANIFAAIAIQQFHVGNEAQGIKFLKLHFDAATDANRASIVEKYIDAGFYKQISPYLKDFSDFNRNNLLLKVATQAIKKGDNIYVHHIINDILKKDYRENFLNQLVFQVANQGQYEEALKILTTFQGATLDAAAFTLYNTAFRDDYQKERRKMLPEILRKRLPEILRQNIHNVKSALNRRYSLGRIALQAVEFGLHDIALEAVGENKRLGAGAQAEKEGMLEKAGALFDLAMKYAELGDDRRAFQLFALSERNLVSGLGRTDIQNDNSKNSLILKIARRLMSEKKFEQALLIAKNMTDNYIVNVLQDMTDVLKTRPVLERSILISEIAIQLGSIGKFEKAEEAAHSINHRQTRDRTWKALALQRSQLGQYDLAILISRRITDFPTKTNLENLLQCSQMTNGTDNQSRKNAR